MTTIAEAITAAGVPVTPVHIDNQQVESHGMSTPATQSWTGA